MSTFKENLYELLNLKEDCSVKEIKQSFIELSKKYHPDRSDNKEYHQIFVKVNEAYSILSKASSRRQYDRHLHINRDRPYVHYYENIYTTRTQRTNYGKEPYYGIKGLKKVPNSVIVAVCILLATLGAGVEFFAIRNSFTFDRERLQHDSARNQLILECVRKEAAELGNEAQIERLKKGIVPGESLRYYNQLYISRLKASQKYFNGSEK